MGNSIVELDGVSYDVCPQVAGLLQAVSEERDEAFLHLKKALVIIDGAYLRNFSTSRRVWQTVAVEWRDECRKIIGAKSASCGVKGVK